MSLVLMLQATDSRVRDQIAAARRQADIALAAGRDSRFDDLLCRAQALGMQLGFEAIKVVERDGLFYGEYADNDAFRRHGTWYAFKRAPSLDAALDLAKAWYAADPQRRDVYVQEQPCDRCGGDGVQQRLPLPFLQALARRA